MDRLPTELLQEILSHCRRQDALQLRLVNKSLSRASTPLAFEHVYLCCFAFSLSKLHSLAKSAHGKCVKKITVYTDHLAILEWEFFRISIVRAAYDDWNDEPTTNYWPPESQWPEAWQTYENYLAEQAAFHDIHTSRTVLGQAFAALINLEELVLQHFDNGRMLPIISKPIPWTVSSNSIALAEQITQTLSHRRYLEDGWTTALILDAIGQRASTKPHTHVRRLEIATRMESEIPLGDNVSPSSTENANHVSNVVLEAVQHVRFLNVSPVNGDSLERAMTTQLQRLLENCIQVRELTLHCGGTDKEYCLKRDNYPLSFMFGASPLLWPDLESLSIATASLHSHHMNAFMTAHSEKLKSLKMSGCWFDDAKPVLRKIPEVLRLQHIYLQELLDPSCLDIDAPADAVYFQHGTDTDPDVRYWLLTGNGDPPTIDPAPREVDSDIDVYGADDLSSDGELHSDEELG